MGDTVTAVDQASMLELQNENLRLQLEVEKLRQQRASRSSEDKSPGQMEKSSAERSLEGAAGSTTAGQDADAKTLEEQMEMAILPPMQISAMVQVTHMSAALTALENLNDFRDTCGSLYDDGSRGAAKVTTHQTWYEYILSTRSGESLVKNLQGNAGTKNGVERLTVEQGDSTNHGR